MRIVFLTTTSMESPYGVGRCMPIARALVRAGHDVRVVALHHDLRTAKHRRYVDDGVIVEYVGQMHVRKEDNSTAYFGPWRLLWVLLTGTVAQTWAAIRLCGDIYHIGKPHPQNSVAGLIASLWHRRSHVFLDYDDLEAASNRTSGNLQRRGLAFLERVVPLRVAGVTTHATFLYARLRALGIPASRLLQLPSAVDSARLQAADLATADRLRRQLRLEGMRVILYVGSLSLANHPVDLLLEAFAILRRTCEAAVLVLVGGGADFDRLQALATTEGVAASCRFVGRTSPDLVGAYFRLADLSVDPVRDDDVSRARWPLKIAESIVAGVPVVTGDVGDRNAMLGDGEAGLLVAPGDAQGLAAAMASLLQNDARLARLRDGCSRQASRFDADQAAAHLLAFYTRVIAESDRS